ncbi:MAG: ABC transporter substrate-binding protein [Lysobacterales bacterium]|nr:MAG: ABC transporter substrate-binding protein [Xanthomonadales bacterium]
MATTRSFCADTLRTALLALAGLLAQACAPSDEAGPPSGGAAPPAAGAETPLAPIRVSGSYWIELSPVLVAANSYYPTQLPVGEGGITRITSGEADLATNAETQLLRESVTNPDLRIIMTVTESFYRLVARRSAGIETLADLRGKRVMVPRLTSANYFLVAMLRTVGLTEADVELVNLLPAEGEQTGMDQMSDALARGDVDVISIWEPEPEDAIRQLEDDAIVFQDRSIYREVFNLHARAADLADPEKRRSIVTFVRAVAEATAALEADPERHWRHVSSITGFSPEEIAWGWPEMEFPVRIVPDMLDVLEVEEAWVAAASGRGPRSRGELAKFNDGSVVEEALTAE